MTTKQDILIIGGGAVGICTAYFLAQQGQSVTLLEKNELSSGSSYGNAGLIAVDHAIPTAAPGVMSQGIRWLLNPESPFSIKPRLDPDQLRWLWRFRGACQTGPMRRSIPVLLGLGQTSMALFEELHARHAMDDDFQYNGRIILYRTQAGLDHAIEELDLLGEYGVTGQVLDAKGVLAMEPSVQPDIAGGVYYNGYAHLVPDRFVLELARVCESMGVRIHTGTEVLGFETSDKRITSVITTRGAHQADEVILAAGVWSTPIARLLGRKVPIEGAKGYSITAKRPADSLTLPVQLGEAKVAVTPMGEFLRFSSTLELTGLDMSINQRRVAATRQAMSQYLTGVAALEELELWRGLRPMSPDSLPIIGRDGAYRNLIYATGHGMLGITQGPITGKLVTQIITGDQPDLDLTPFSPLRF